MNYAGIAGGLPSNSSSTLRKRADANEKEGATDSARAARIRARNVDEHAKQTAKTKKDIKLKQLEAAAKKPGASGFAKDRYKMAKETGMYAKGGSVASKRADGCATKGKTKGRFV
jgi:septal ring-binding cell division protein DamX